MVDSPLGFGRGKVILLGEHSVVHGSPAIAVGINRGTSAVARLADEDLLTVSPWSSRARPHHDGEDPLERAFAIALDAYSNRPGLRIDAQVDLPAGAGLGCSAALGVAVFDAIDKALCVNRSRQELGEMVHEWEEVFHGAASGIDNMTAAIGGVLRYQKETPLKPLSLAQPLHVVIAHSGETSKTKDMVSLVACQLASNPARVRDKFDEMSDLVDEAEAALSMGDMLGLGRLLNRNHGVLGSLLLCTPRVEELCRLARAAGALGAKVTGAGGGGCIVALAEDEKHAHRIRDVLGSRSFVDEVRQ
jgi:mevalonate kinase